METKTTLDLWQLIQSAGIGGVLFVILVGGVKKWWVFGWMYHDIRRERDEWKAMALRGTDLATRAVQTLEKTHNGT